MNTQIHINESQSSELHLSKDQKEALVRVATADKNGLLPDGALYGIIYYKTPKSATSPGKRGMQAFDDKYYYICFEDNKWKRVALHEF